MKINCVVLESEIASGFCAMTVAGPGSACPPAPSWGPLLSWGSAVPPPRVPARN